jgi:hypothetical protein
MHWLVVVRKSLAHDDRLELFERLAVTAQEDDGAVDIDDGWVIEVEGPADLPEQCRSYEEVIDVYPSSEMTYLTD